MQTNISEDIKQTHAELKNHLAEQINFIRKTAKEYDLGDIAEAKRIATHLRVLLHDTKRSSSFLGILGIKAKIAFLNSGFAFNPNNLSAHTGLVKIEASNDHRALS